jgi:hypothetical protein
MIRKFLQTNLQSLPFSRLSRSSHDYLLTREPVTIYPKLYLAPNRKANLTSTISVAIYNTQVQTLTFNLLQEKNHVLKIMCPYLFMKNRLAEN